VLLLPKNGLANPISAENRRTTQLTHTPDSSIAQDPGAADFSRLSLHRRAGVPVSHGFVSFDLPSLTFWKFDFVRIISVMNIVWPNSGAASFISHVKVAGDRIRPRPIRVIMQYSS